MFAMLAVRRRRPESRLVVVTEVGDEVAVAFDQVYDLENVAVRLGRKITEENQVALERS